MSDTHFPQDFDPFDAEEPRLADGRASMWISVVIGAVMLVGTAASVLALGQSDDIANRKIAAENAPQVGAPIATAATP